MATDPLLPLRDALARPWQASSDYDLNPGTVLPENRVLRPAAVLVGIVPGGQEGPQLVLTKRASHLRNHPGQIAFPGGRKDEGDADLVATALREAEEEIGLPPTAVEILGALPAHETVTGYQMTPILGLITRDFTPRPQPDEVAEIFSAPFAHVTNPARFRVEQRIWRGTWRKYYTVPWGPYYIWGATARILRGLADRVGPCG
ncbi:MAG: CoA pyrophosphatase [Roseinatronobacter sp.]|jgi:8-oxo-dGTP pyrophosphatase MutT (NUDIX family)|nr:CoA pyrophosphatase [Roseinatronobacter sp.]